MFVSQRDTTETLPTGSSSRHTATRLSTREPLGLPESVSEQSRLSALALEVVADDAGLFLYTPLQALTRPFPYHVAAVI